MASICIANDLLLVSVTLCVSSEMTVYILKDMAMSNQTVIIVFVFIII